MSDEKILYERKNIFNLEGYQLPAVISEAVTLRDQFAMAAITGYLSPDKHAREVKAKYAYAMADAMLKAREEK